jgi:hypothetical protein
MSAPPRWLTPALGLWVVLATVALANLTQIIWTVVVVATALEIGWGLVLHARRPPVPAVPPPPPPLEPHLRALADRLGRVEDLLTRVD